MRLLISAHAKARDKELAKYQTFCLDVLAPLARNIHEARSGTSHLSTADFLQMVDTAARLAANMNAHLTRIRPTSVLQCVNPRIVDMAEEEEIFEEQGGSFSATASRS